jgi:CRP/FNR family cyclic AMP-dependent transcriptional regulator
MAVTGSITGAMTSRHRQRMASLRLLEQNTLLADVPRRQLRILARYAERLEIAADEVVISERETGTHMGIVLRGGCEVRCSDQCVSHVGPGETFGELALLENAPRAVSVVTTEHTEVLAFARSDFEHVLKVAPALRPALTRQANQGRSDQGD